MPVKSSDVLLERGAKALGLTAYPAPVAILSQAHNGRPACFIVGSVMAMAAKLTPNLLHWCR
jgi:hypothetical protein